MFDSRTEGSDKELHERSRQQWASKNTIFVAAVILAGKTVSFLDEGLMVVDSNSKRNSSSKLDLYVAAKL